MKRNQRLAGAILSAALAVFVTAGIARSEEKHSAAPQEGGSTLSMARFYGGAGARIGDYPGKLVCLRCDLKGGPEAMAQCEKAGHRHALAMESDGMVHPLLPGTEKVLKQINSGELHGKEVTVHGMYYPATGAILVDRIAEKK
ncbi:MAG: hypothetical protein ACHQ9S_10800 [Candidatus Binatia bacterium]